MTSVVVDTHAAIWYLTEFDKLSARALATLDDVIASGEILYLASISLVEMCYLVEKGRITRAVFDRILHALDKQPPQLRLIALDRSIAQTLEFVSRDAIPDMPDRIIAATALHLNLPLVSRDHKIQASSIQTIW